MGRRILSAAGAVACIYLAFWAGHQIPAWWAAPTMVVAGLGAFGSLAALMVAIIP